MIQNYFALAAYSNHNENSYYFIFDNEALFLYSSNQQQFYTKEMVQDAFLMKNSRD